MDMKTTYISATFNDLKSYRKEASEQVRKSGLVDVAMEYYLAEDVRPLDKCLRDVRDCDLYIGIFAWRYGYTPPESTMSITEMEYREAGEHGKDRLIFLLDEKHPWNIGNIDAHLGHANNGTKIKELRSELEQLGGVVSYFTSTDNFAAKIAAALSKWKSDKEKGNSKKSEDGKSKEDVVLDDVLARYLKAIVLQHQADKIGRYYVDMSGKGEVKIQPPSHRESRLIPRSMQRVLSEQLLQNEGHTEQKFESIEDALFELNSFVLTGAPGSGKSTTLKQIELNAARRYKESSGLRVPLAINLAEWPNSIQDMGSLIVHEARLKGLPRVPLASLLLLFDGLNEVADSQYRQVIDALRKWTIDHSEVQVIVATRKREYFNSDTLPLEVVEILPLDDDRIKKFVINYLGKEAGEQVLSRIGWRQVNSLASSELIELARNPYELLSICFVYSNSDKIPNNRSELFYLLIECLYEREADLGNTKGISFEEMQQVFGLIAIEMFEAKSSTSAHLPWAIKKIPGTIFPDSLWHLGVSANIIYFTKNNLFFQFSHHLLQEFFAAIYLSSDACRLKNCLSKPAFSNWNRKSRPIDEAIFILIQLGDTVEVLKKVSEIDAYVAIDAILSFKRLQRDPNIIPILSGIIIPILINGLESRNENKKHASLKRLSDLGNIAVNTLSKAFRPSNPRLKRQIILSLSTIDTAESTSQLLNILTEKGKKNKRVRKDSLDVIRTRHLDHIQSVKDFVLTKLGSLSSDDRRKIAGELIDLYIEDNYAFAAFISDETGVEIDFDKDPKPKPQTLNENNESFEENSGENAPLAGDSESLIQNLVKRLGESNSADAVDTLQDLIKMGEDVVPELIPYLDSSNPKIRRRLPRVFGKLKSLEAVEPLIKICKDRNGRVRVHAVKGLLGIGDSRMLPVVSTMLDDPVANVRYHCISAITKLGGPEYIDVIKNILSDENGDNRFAALKYLQKSNFLELRRYANGLIDDRQISVKLLVISILIEFEDRSSLEKIRYFATNGDRDLRRYAIRALGTLGDKTDLSFLSMVTKDVDDFISNEALLSYVKICKEDAMGLIESALLSESYRTKVTGLRALAELRNTSTLSMALIYLFDDEAHVKEQSIKTVITIINTISEHGTRDELCEVPMLSRFPDRRVKLCIARALGSFGMRADTKYLYHLLEESDYSTLSDVASKALGNILGDEELESLDIKKT